LKEIICFIFLFIFELHIFLWWKRILCGINRAFVFDKVKKICNINEKLYYIKRLWILQRSTRNRNNIILFIHRYFFYIPLAAAVDPNGWWRLCVKALIVTVKPDSPRCDLINVKKGVYYPTKHKIMQYRSLHYTFS